MEDSWLRKTLVQHNRHKNHLCLIRARRVISSLFTLSDCVCIHLFCTSHWEWFYFLASVLLLIDSYPFCLGWKSWISCYFFSLFCLLQAAGDMAELPYCKDFLKRSIKQRLFWKSFRGERSKYYLWEFFHDLSWNQEILKRVLKRKWIK